GAIADFMADPGNPDFDPMTMVTFPSIKAGKGDGPTTSCQLLCLADFAWFAKYSGRRTRRRGTEYKPLKAALAGRLLHILLPFYPHPEGRIDSVDVSTALSIQHYLGAHEGGAVGLEHAPSRFTDWEVVRHLDMRTRIPGLWLTGQDTVTCGQPVVQAAG